MGTKSNRNYGIDLLRLVAMFLIVLLHLLDHGGIISASSGATFYVARFLQCIVYCAVNIYALISGYVGYSEEEKPYRFYKYIPMWLQVVFYCFIPTLIFFFLDDTITVTKVFGSLLPVFTNKYWYFTAYAPLFFLEPWLNKMIRSSSKKELNALVGILVFFFSIYSFSTDIFHISLGMSFAWLTVLYIIGAWIKKNDIPSTLHKAIPPIVALGSLALTYVGTVFLHDHFRLHALIVYTSPTMLLLAISFVLMFVDLSFGNGMKKMISFLAPCSFAIYLLHCSPMIWSHCIVGQFAWIGSSPAWLMVLEVFGCALLIMIFGVLIEKIRAWIFQLLHVDQGAQRLQQLIKRLHLMQ